MTGSGFPFAAERLLDRLHGRRQRWFISHAYKDADAVAALRASLPQTVEPFIFPPIEVTPDQVVSDPLIGAIRDCRGLIYIQSEISQASFWVNFERRYASRLGKPVVAFTAGARRPFSRVEVTVGNTVALLWNSSITHDADLAGKLARWLREQRSVYTERVFASTLKQDPMWGYWYSTMGDEPVYGEDDWSLEHKIAELGASIVCLVSPDSFTQPWPFRDETCFVRDGETMRMRTHIDVAWLAPPTEDFVAWLDRAEAPPHEVLLRRVVLQSARAPNRLVLAQDGNLDWNRADDLLVRIEHAAFQRGAEQGPSRRHIRERMNILSHMERMRQARYG